MNPIKILFSGTLVLTFTLGLCLVVQIAKASPTNFPTEPASLAYVMPVDGMWVAPIEQEVTVMKAVVCSSIENREPVGTSSSFSKDVGRVYCYSKLELAAGTSETVRHVWKHNDKTISTVELTVKGPAYRTRSYKTITSRMTGDWTVEIQNSQGDVLDTIAFTID